MLDPTPQKLAFRYQQMLDKRASSSSACNPNSLAFAWVSPSGRLIELPGMQTHTVWATTNFSKYPPVKRLVEDKDVDPSEAFLKTGWVRFVNARHLDVWSLRTLNSRKTADTVCQVLVDCVVPGTDPEAALVWISLVKSGGSATKMSLAEFMAKYASPKLEAAFYARLGV
tara:strand:- start:1552 stop:2061 length:510 start_codon:yes stop_codon:yes gene_type:complete